ncbi:MAG: hypothetical protein ORN57_03840, partial [Alphaproteobacteria bacterium]|nr:hypothetical protein [Alphaproteobacteria bacterium]
YISDYISDKEKMKTTFKRWLGTRLLATAHPSPSTSIIANHKKPTPPVLTPTMALARKIADSLNTRKLGGRLTAGMMMMSFVLIPWGQAHRAQAADNSKACAHVRFANPGWTDILVTTAFGVNVLKALGYDSKDITIGATVAWQSLANGDVELFLGNWHPSQDEKANEILASGKAKIIGTNLIGTRYGLATSKRAYDEGLKTIQDMPKFRNKLKGKIYGIDAGSAGNKNTMAAIKLAGIEGFKLVESSEAGMLSQLDRHKNDYVLFLGWTPHWMNNKYPMVYLSGPEIERFFGKDNGFGVVRTIANSKFVQQCPNAAKFAANLKFTIEMENTLMSLVGEQKKDPNKVVVEYLRTNPTVLDHWLRGVTTKDGGNAIAAVKKAFDIRL